MELKDLIYEYIINLTKFFLDKYYKGDLKELEMVVHNLRIHVPNIIDMNYIFDESIWLPENRATDFRNLIEFKVRIHNSFEYLPFRLYLNKGFEQEPILLKSYNYWNV